MLLVLIAALPGIAAQTWFLVGERFSDRSGCYHGARRAEAIVLRLRKQSVASVTCRIIPRY